jgi:hypothetical protein
MKGIEVKSGPLLEYGPEETTPKLAQPETENIMCCQKKRLYVVAKVFLKGSYQI